jgi:hypothetical protein
MTEQTLALRFGFLNGMITLLITHEGDKWCFHWGSEVPLPLEAVA